MNKIILLDRDGVINFDSKDYIRTPEQWQSIPGSLEAIAMLNQKGFKVAVVTNQSGIGRGYYTVDTLNAIHQKMQDAVEKVGGYIDKIVYCPHTPSDNCECRKPKPGLIRQLEAHYNQSLENAYMVGDKLSDLQTIQGIDGKAVLVKTGDGIQTLSKLTDDSNVIIAENLAEFVGSL